MRTVMRKPGKSAVSPVIGTILMVAITVVLAAVLYIVVLGFAPGGSTQTPTMTLLPGTWSNNSVLSIQISSISTTNTKYTDLIFQVSDKNSTVCFTGAAGAAAGTTCTGMSVTVTYTDAQSEGNVDTLDRIVVTGTPNALGLKGGQLKVTLAGSGATVVSITLPSA